MQIKNYKFAAASEWKPMSGSDAIGLQLVKHNNFAADMLDFGADQQTSLHTHVGEHILYVVSGHGWLDYANQTHGLEPGTCYFVPGAVPHRIRASAWGLTLLSVANQHQPVDSAARLEVLDV